MKYIDNIPAQSRKGNTNRKSKGSSSSDEKGRRRDTEERMVNSNRLGKFHRSTKTKKENLQEGGTLQQRLEVQRSIIR